MTGSGETISLSAGDGLWLGGNGAWGTTDLVSGSSSNVNLFANSRMDLTNSGGTVNAGANSNLGVTGSGETISLSADDGLWLGGNGAWGTTDLVSGSSSNVNLFANSRMDLARTRAARSMLARIRTSA